MQDHVINVIELETVAAYLKHAKRKLKKSTSFGPKIKETIDEDLATTLSQSFPTLKFISFFHLDLCFDSPKSAVIVLDALAGVPRLSKLGVSFHRSDFKVSGTLTDAFVRLFETLRTLKGISLSLQFRTWNDVMKIVSTISRNVAELFSLRLRLNDPSRTHADQRNICEALYHAYNMRYLRSVNLEVSSSRFKALSIAREHFEDMFRTPREGPITVLFGGMLAPFQALITRLVEESERGTLFPPAPAPAPAQMFSFQNATFSQMLNYLPTLLTAARSVLALHDFKINLPSTGVPPSFSVACDTLSQNAFTFPLRKAPRRAFGADPVALEVQADELLQRVQKRLRFVDFLRQVGDNPSAMIARDVTATIRDATLWKGEEGNFFEAATRSETFSGPAIDEGIAKYVRSDLPENRFFAEAGTEGGA
eukprot:gnl/Chilomastix_cuspidata/1791.p1 GENE.gnl/Chilomastix_cuspidata/1791~~gnl/Chilomastix_cuspidata/1791.p1  ORF type:complete len:423 (-),score=157.23 gnl/Chilomastix_cuspidata/1791:22-1290(-)